MRFFIVILSLLFISCSQSQKRKNSNPMNFKSQHSSIYNQRAVASDKKASHRDSDNKDILLKIRAEEKKLSDPSLEDQNQFVTIYKK